jgi:hypothetical protein
LKREIQKGSEKNINKPPTSNHESKKKVIISIRILGENKAMSKSDCTHQNKALNLKIIKFNEKENSENK